MIFFECILISELYTENTVNVLFATPTITLSSRGNVNGTNKRKLRKISNPIHNTFIMGGNNGL